MFVSSNISYYRIIHIFGILSLISSVLLIGAGASYDAEAPTSNNSSAGFQGEETDNNSGYFPANESHSGVEVSEDYNSVGQIWASTGNGSEDIMLTIPGRYLVTCSEELISEQYHINGNSELKEGEWARKYGGENSESAKVLVQSSDSGYLLAGQTSLSDPEGEYIWLLKTNSEGDKEWVRVYGWLEENKTYSYNEPSSLVQTPDGGYLIAGECNAFGSKLRDIFVLKVDSEGKEEWHKLFGGNYNEEYPKIAAVDNGNYVIAWNTWKPSNDEVWLMEIDSKGKEIWNRKLGTTRDIEVASILPVDGGYLLAVTVAYWYHEVAWDSQFHMSGLAKTDLEGNVIWIKVFKHGREFKATEAFKLSNETYMLVGNGLTVITNSGGEEIWSTNFGTRSLQKTPDGGYLVYSTKYFRGSLNIFLTKTDSEFFVEWNRGLTSPMDDVIADLIVVSDDEIALTGHIREHESPLTDALLLKLSLKGAIPPSQPFPSDTPVQTIN